MAARTQDDLMCWYYSTGLMRIAGHEEDISEFLVSSRRRNGRELFEMKNQKVIQRLVPE